MTVSLVAFSTSILERFHEALTLGRLTLPASEASLRAAGLAPLVTVAEKLSAIGAAGVTAVLEATLAERRRPRSSGAELVWTGPEAKVSRARDTAVVVRELFSMARRSVLIAGFRFDSGSSLLAPLHEVMKAHGVQCDLFGDAEDLRTFREKNWPFGEPFPRLFRDARTSPYASLHAKCIVVDGCRSLVTSANFTDRGQQRNIEVGVLLDDSEFARTLTGQWMGAVSEGVFVPASDFPGG